MITLHPEQAALLGAALFVGVVARRLPRAVLWVVLGGVSFVLSTAWARYDMPYPPWFTGMCDAFFCIGLHHYGKQKWESRLYNLFQLSVLLSIGQLIGFFRNVVELAEFLGLNEGVIEPHQVYVIGLETINWLALFLILAAAVVTPERLHGRVYPGRDTAPRIRWAQRALHAQRASPPWAEGPE